MFRLAERNKADAGGDLEDRRQWRWGGHRQRPGSLLPLLHQGSVVTRRRSEGHLGRSRPGCSGPMQRNTRSRGGGSASSALHTPELWASSGMFPALLSTPSAGPASQAARGYASSRPPAPAAPNAARTCPHLHSKMYVRYVNMGISCVSGPEAATLMGSSGSHASETYGL